MCAGQGFLVGRLIREIITIGIGAELGYVRSAIYAIEDHVAPLAQFIRDSFRRQSPDDAAVRCGIENDVIAGCAPAALSSRCMVLMMSPRSPMRRRVCELGLKGLVSKRFDSPYHSGPSSDWVKVKNRKHHAFTRVTEAIS